LKFLPIFSRVWQDILIDFMINLGPSLIKKKAYDSILIVINKYSKIIWFISYNKDMDAPELAEIIKNQKFKYFDLFSLYVTDKEILFISN
jgi:hypothetical protein